MATIVHGEGRESHAGACTLQGKPDTARPTPRTLRGLSSPRGPAHYPRLPNYHLMCPDMTNVVDNRWTMRSQPFNTATKRWTGLWPCGSKSNTFPRACCLPGRPGFRVHPHPSVHVLISYPVSRPASYPRITAHTYLLRVVIIRRMEKVPTWSCNWVFTAAGS